MRGGPPTPLGEQLAAAEAILRSRELHGAPPEPEASPSAPPEPAPNSPEDVGFRPPPRAAHEPKKCRSCGASIFWAKTEAGKSMPVDAHPHPEGRVVLFDRGGSVIAKVLGKEEQPRPGENTRRPHWTTCPQAGNWRKR